MIWVRRILASLLGFLFAVTFISALLLTHVSGTLGSAGFYNGQMTQADVYNWVHRDLTPAMLNDTGDESPTDFPVNTPEFREDMAGVVEQTFPASWLQTTFEGATGQVVPYMVGDTDTFVVTIALRDRIDPMVTGVNGVVDAHSAEIYDYVTADLITPAITEELSQGADLPYGITLSEEEINGVVTESMEEAESIGWFKDMVETMGAYVEGEEDELYLMIDISSAKSRAATAINALVDQKLRTAFDSTPATCSEMEFLVQLQTLPENTLPSCRPPGYTYQQFKQALETHMANDPDGPDNFTQAVEQEVMALIPNSYEFDDDQMRETLGEDTADTLDTIREFIVEDQGRITDQNLEDLMSEDEDETGMSSVEAEKDLDNARNAIHMVKMLQYVLWPVAVLLLVAIGFLGGRNWKSRLLWAAGTLLITSLVFLVAVAVSSAVVPDDERFVSRPEGSDATAVSILMADKGDEIAHNAVNTLIWGLELKLIICVVVAVVIVAGAIVWYVVDRKRQGPALTEKGAAPAPSDPGSPPAASDAGYPPGPSGSSGPPTPSDPGSPPA